MTESKLKRAQVMTLAAAFLGWLFDGFEMGLFPLIGQPALKDLLGANGTNDTAKWFGAIIAVFLVGAASGGVLFGWLGDKIGRVRAMSFSIFTYAIFTGLCGFATEAWHIAALRFIAALGMGGEWSLGVALVNEIWPGKSRALTAGLIGAAANIGYLLVAVLSMTVLKITVAEAQQMFPAISPETVSRLFSNSAWRLLMISGAFPALLIFFILMFVPESEKWKAEHARGTTAHWEKTDLFGVLIGTLAALAIIWAWSPVGVSALPATAITFVGLGVALVGYLHPVKKYLLRAEAAGSVKSGDGKIFVQRMLFGAGLAAVALLGTWGSTQWASRWVVDEFKPDPALHAKEWTLFWLSAGAIVGTMVAALSAGRFGRRKTYTALCIASIGGALLLYQCNTNYSPFFLFSAFVAGAATASFYGFFPLYLPELFPTAMRATGQGFAFNFGRIIAAVGGLQTANLMKHFDNSFPKAASTMTVIYLIGMVIIWFGPETKDQPLPE